MTHRWRHGDMWHEQTVTDLLCEAANPFITYHQFNSKMERVVGADWLWWWVYATGECFGLLCQAKTLPPNGNGWKIDFRYPNGTGDQMRNLFKTADLFEVPAAYMLYCGDIEYRGDLRCVPRHDPQPCGRCERASVSIVAGLLAEYVSVGVRPAEAATNAFHLSLPLEDLADPVGGLAPVMDLNIGGIGDTELRGFLFKPQHGPRQIAKGLLAPVSQVRHLQFSLATAEPVDVGAHMTVFPEVPADRGHFGSPYFQHILRGLRAEPPTYMQDILVGRKTPSWVTEHVAGIVVVHL